MKKIKSNIHKMHIFITYNIFTANFTKLIFIMFMCFHYIKYIAQKMHTHANLQIFKFLIKNIKMQAIKYFNQLP